MRPALILKGFRDLSRPSAPQSKSSADSGGQPVSLPPLLGAQPWCSPGSPQGFSRQGAHLDVGMSPTRLTSPLRDGRLCCPASPEPSRFPPVTDPRGPAATDSWCFCGTFFPQMQSFHSISIQQEHSAQGHRQTAEPQLPLSVTSDNPRGVAGGGDFLPSLPNKSAVP